MPLGAAALGHSVVCAAAAPSLSLPIYAGFSVSDFSGRMPGFAALPLAIWKGGKKGSKDRELIDHTQSPAEQQ